MSILGYYLSKKDITPTLPTLEGYIDDEVMMQHQDEIFYCIAANDNDLTPAEIIRYKLYNIAGKVISHARESILKVNEEFIKLLQIIR